MNPENFENKEVGAEGESDFKNKIKELYEREKSGEMKSSHFYRKDREGVEEEFGIDDLTAEDEEMWKRINEVDIEAEGEHKIMEEFNRYRAKLNEGGESASEKLASYLSSVLARKMYNRE